MNLAELIEEGRRRIAAGSWVSPQEERFLADCRAEYARRVKHWAGCLQVAEAEYLAGPEL